ncbi:MAG: hypothetical protein CL846_02140 [Crocinitomicaceae bacterium]|nr:hypothetical protein [Crocinitomicaceae bacterium]|tara:strand:+ start:3585 stop:4394 length:810 start_codon:yes stop_codon:yes gene_type:complete
MKENFQTLRYKGYSTTPLLWNNDEIAGLNQFKIENHNLKIDLISSFNEIRLGKLIEQFVLNDLSSNINVEIIASNIQIIDNRITVGEIDALMKHLNDFIHLEIVYKFYLYDPSIKTSEIDRWIGPNRNDWLSKKIEKLKTKQFPILNHAKTKSILNQLGLSSNLFQQKVLFKAQLFVPFNMLNNNFELINNQCIKGFYLSFEEVQKLNTLFYIPSKLDWLLEPHLNVNWLNYSKFILELEIILKQKQSPLCWIKNSQNELQKIFVVFWN